MFLLLKKPIQQLPQNGQLLSLSTPFLFSLAWTWCSWAWTFTPGLQKPSKIKIYFSKSALQIWLSFLASKELVFLSLSDRFLLILLFIFMSLKLFLVPCFRLLEKNGAFGYADPNGLFFPALNLVFSPLLFWLNILAIVLVLVQCSVVKVSLTRSLSCQFQDLWFAREFITFSTNTIQKVQYGRKFLCGDTLHQWIWLTGSHMIQPSDIKWVLVKLCHNLPGGKPIILYPGIDRNNR